MTLPLLKTITCPLARTIFKIGYSYLTVASLYSGKLNCMLKINAISCFKQHFVKLQDYNIYMYNYIYMSDK